MLFDYWLKFLRIRCLHYFPYLVLFETNSRNKQVPNYSHTSNQNHKLFILYFIHHQFTSGAWGTTIYSHLFKSYDLQDYDCDILNWDTIDYLLPVQPLDLSAAAAEYFVYLNNKDSDYIVKQSFLMSKNLRSMNNFILFLFILLFCHTE